jgi:hypothetical protein
VANRKQRRRREKDKRHDYEVVYLDSEGNEVEVDDDRADRKPRAKSSGGSRSSTPTSSRRGIAQPPSWSRVIRRGAIFAPIFLVIVYLLGRDQLGVTGAVLQTVLLVCIFVPFSYFMDRVMWRSHQKRLAKRK